MTTTTTPERTYVPDGTELWVTLPGGEIRTEPLDIESYPCGVGTTELDFVIRFLLAHALMEGRTITDLAQATWQVMVG